MNPIFIMTVAAGEVVLGIHFSKPARRLSALQH